MTFGQLFSESVCIQGVCSVCNLLHTPIIFWKITITTYQVQQKKLSHSQRGYKCLKQNPQPWLGEGLCLYSACIAHQKRSSLRHHVLWPYPIQFAKYLLVYPQGLLGLALTICFRSHDCKDLICGKTDCLKFVPHEISKCDVTNSTLCVKSSSFIKSAGQTKSWFQSPWSAAWQIDWFFLPESLMNYVLLCH